MVKDPRGIGETQRLQVDLVVVALGGVQRFIAESRTTADVAGASSIIQELSRVAAKSVQRSLAEMSDSCGLIVPTVGGVDADGVTNRLAFLSEFGHGPEIAKLAVQRVHDAWTTRVRNAFGGTPPPQTPGMPDTCWVSVSGPIDTDEQYRQLWKAAQSALVARRRTRVFEFAPVVDRSLCSQSPQSAAADRPPRGARRHERARKEDLSAANWVKRLAGRAGNDGAFPSTLAIASAPYRHALLDDDTLHTALTEPVRALCDAVAQFTDLLLEPGASAGRWPEDLRPLGTQLGPWVHPGVWDEADLAREYEPAPTADIVAAGRRAAQEIRRIARAAGIAGPTPYYAVLVQDADKLGRAMSDLGMGAQQAASGLLTDLARAERDTVTAHQGFTVYAGGDDLLVFCPAAKALALAEKLRALFADRVTGGDLLSNGHPITASTGVVFAHMTSPLGETMAAAHDALGEAKELGRDALAVVARTRGGERARTIQPWRIDRTGPDGGNAAQLLRAIVPSPQEFSPAFASDLERDRHMLAELAVHDSAVAVKELTRLVTRHGTPDKDRAAVRARALLWLARRELPAPQAGQPGRFDPVPSALVARFLAQECQ